MQNSDGHQKGPQAHAEGGHGEKTRGKILEQLHSGASRKAKEPAEHPGAHRLVAERKQHEAGKIFGGLGQGQGRSGSDPRQVTEGQPSKSSLVLTTSDHTDGGRT